MKDQKARQIISDEMNLGEFPLASISDRIPTGVNELVSVDEIKHPITGEPLTRKITVRGQEPFGLPTAKDEEILMGCLKATSESGFRSRKVEINPAEFLRSIRWKTDGPAYKRWKKGMDRWSTVSVESVDAFWHRGKKKPVRDILGIIDRWQERGEDPITGLPEKAFFVWGDFMWESFKAGNLKNLDFDFWLTCENAVTKRLFRLLDKKFYRQKRLAFPLKDFAVNKLGMSRKNSNGQIKQTLQGTHNELFGKEFCKAEYVGRGEEAKVVYHSLRSKQGNDDPLVQSLKDRGVRGIDKLITGKDRLRIEEAIKNFDHRNKMGERRKAGWLHDDIAGEAPYSFRDDYRDEKALASAAKKAKRLRQQEAARQRRIVEDCDRRRKSRKATFEKYFGALDKDQQRRFREQAIKHSSHCKLLSKSNPLQNRLYHVYLEDALLNHWERMDTESAK